MEVENLKPLVGSIVHAEPSAMVDGSIGERCRKLMEERGVLVFPKVGLTHEEQLAFTESLGGKLAISAEKKSTMGHETPGVYALTLDPKINTNPEYIHGTFFWHMDTLLSPNPPSKASVLSCRRTAPKGGQTEFANTYAAYAALSDEDKAEVDDLKVVHSLYAILQETVGIPTPEDLARWQYKCTHQLAMPQRSGRKSLLVGGSADYIEGQDYPTGRSLLARLLEWCGQEQFTYKHFWSEGDLVVWDNCGTLHRVVPYAADSGRWMDRTSVASEWDSVAA